METKWECPGCGRRHDSKYMAEGCHPPRQIWLCGNSDCEDGGTHPDLRDAQRCQDDMRRKARAHART